MGLTHQDINFVLYFHKERGDLSSGSYWDDKKEDFQKELPELVKAFNDVLIANKILDAVVDKLDPDNFSDI